MDNAIVSAMAGVLGSVFGASTAIATAWITQKTLNTHQLLRAEVDKRETLYGEFIAECSKAHHRRVWTCTGKARDVVVRVCTAEPHSAFGVRRGSCAGGSHLDVDHGTILLAQPLGR